jgi:hypothetical protein
MKQGDHERLELCRQLYAYVNYALGLIYLDRLIFVTQSRQLS